MSRAGIERACFDLRDKTNLTLFREAPNTYLERYPLTSTERTQLTEGDVGGLFTMEVSAGALGDLMRAFDYDMATYVSKVREALELPVDDAQMTVLRARAGGRKRLV